MNNTVTAPETRNATPNWLGRGLMLLCFLLIPGVPIFMIRGHEEIGLWKAAAAINEITYGNRSEGLSNLQSIGNEWPDNLAIQISLAEQLFDGGQLQAAVDLARRLHSESIQRVDANEKADLEYVLTGRLYSRCLTAVGEPVAALRELEQIQVQLKADSLGDYIDLSNDLAYQSAMTRDGSGSHAVLLQEYFKAIQAREPFGKLQNIPIQTRAAVAVALVAVELKETNRVIPELNRQIEICEFILSRLEAGTIQQYLKWIPGMISANPAEESANVKEQQFREELITEELSLLLLVRALCLEQTSSKDELDQSIRDRFRIQDLGYEVDQLSKLLPDLRECADTCDFASSLLDTRGYLFLGMGTLELAMPDLNLACVAHELGDRLVRELIGQNPNNPTDPRLVAIHQQRTMAVLLKHRGECLEALHQPDAAATDFARVRSLGYEPDDPALF